MKKIITKITEDIIEVVETISETKVTQHNKNSLLVMKKNHEDAIKKIDKLLTEF